VWAIVLIVAAVLVPVMGILAAIAIPMFLMQSEKAKDSSAKEGAHMIQIGIQSWAVDHNDEFPSVEDVSANGAIAHYVDRWPTNPWTDAPMQPGPSEGDFEYAVAPDGSDYALIVHLSGGDAWTIR
jgi:competence protein ComGC